MRVWLPDYRSNFSFQFPTSWFRIDPESDFIYGICSKPIKPVVEINSLYIKSRMTLNLGPSSHQTPSHSLLCSLVLSLSWLFREWTRLLLSHPWLSP